jgi:hypothetical protein
MGGSAGDAWWAGASASDSGFLCYIDGVSAMGPPVAHNATPRPPYDRVVVGVVEGHSQIIVMGYRDSLAIPSPPI